MDPISTILAATLKKLAASLSAEVRRHVRRAITICRKLAWPRRDARSGILQSRMRYYRIKFTSRDLATLAFQEVDSNGNVTRYVTSSGRRFLPPELHEAVIVDGGRFQNPPWKPKIDWKDVLNGDTETGCWGISEP